MSLVVTPVSGVGTTEEFMTLPNMLKHFGNTRLTGFSTGTGKATAATSGLNVAISGAIATGMPDQACPLPCRLGYSAVWDIIRLCRVRDRHSAEAVAKPRMHGEAWTRAVQHA